MFCFQCEQTAKCTGCTGNAGVCGKKADTARIQDDLTGALIGLAGAAVNNAALRTDSAAALVVEGLFATLTNVNFDNDALLAILHRVEAEKRKMVIANDYDMRRLWNAEEDIRSPKSLILFGIRGLAAYAYHAAVLGYQEDAIHRFLYKALAAIGRDDRVCKECGHGCCRNRH